MEDELILVPTVEEQEAILAQALESGCWKRHEKAVELLQTEAMNQWRSGFFGNTKNQVHRLRLFVEGRTKVTPVWMEALQCCLGVACGDEVPVSDLERLWDSAENDGLRFRMLLALLDTDHETWLAKLPEVSVPTQWRQMVLYFYGKNPGGGGLFAALEEIRRGKGKRALSLMKELEEWQNTHAETILWSELLNQLSQDSLSFWHEIKFFVKALRRGPLNEYERQALNFYKTAVAGGYPLDFQNPFTLPVRGQRFAVLCALATKSSLVQDDEWRKALSRELVIESLWSPDTVLSSESPLSEFPYWRLPNVRYEVILAQGL